MTAFTTDIEVRDVRGQSPLEDAILTRCEESVSMLLSNGDVLDRHAVRPENMPFS